MAEVAHTTSSGQLFVQGSLTASNDTVTLARFTTWGALGFQLSGTWTGTVTFEASVDGQNFAALQVTPAGSSTGTTTATANGVWVVPNNAFQSVRARFSTATSGTVVASILSRPSQS